MKTFIRILILLNMILGLCILPQPAVVQARMAETKPEMPASLQDAFLQSSSQPFIKQGINYTTEYNGLNYNLGSAGLQAEGNGVQWGISLRDMGRENSVQDVSAPEIRQTEAQLEYQRGIITEWYRNTTIGVEQGFTVIESPKGNGKLVLHLDLSTDLEGKLDDGARGMSFVGADGQTLRYDGLKAYDSTGAELDAQMLLDAEQVTIQVDDSSAIYPVTIDPRIYMEQKVLAPDGAGDDYFGVSVALSGNIAVVGASRDKNLRGAAYIFVRSGGVWKQQKKLIATDGADLDNFGKSVSVSGNTVLIGAPGDDIGANSDQGSAYVFIQTNGVWKQQRKLVVAGGGAGDQFGYSVSLSGDSALIGAYTADVNGQTDQGAAYVFIRTNGVWSQQAKLTTVDGVAADNFGCAVALAGDTALVGADLNDVNFADQGSAYLFERSGAVWTHKANLVASDGLTADNFGYAVALSASGTTALIGAVNDDYSGYSDTGSAYVYIKPSTGWVTGSETAHLLASNLATGRQFGYSVALYGDLALVGQVWLGGAFLFAKPVSGWGGTISSSDQIAPSDGITGDNYGGSVALSSDAAVMGAFLDDIGSNVDQGSAYFYAVDTHVDLAVQSFASNIAPQVGSAITLNVYAINNGFKDIAAVINAPLPAGFKYVSHVVTHGSYDVSTGKWNAGSVPQGVIATLTINATVNPSGQTIFTAKSSASDSNNANNSATLKITPKAILKSFFLHDGWVLESSENSNAGQSLNISGTTIRIGDDAARKQYRGILSFGSYILSDTAVILNATLRVRWQGVVGGGNPVTAFQGFMVDVHKGPFGLAPLEASDWQATPSKAVGPVKPALTGGWYNINLTSAKDYINKWNSGDGLTQIRLRFNLDDNNDAVANYLSLYSGNVAAASQPQLIIQYYVP